MSFLQLYLRVLRQLGPELRLGLLLAAANVGLAIAAFAEPVLFGRIVDALATAQGTKTPPDPARLTPLILAWIGFGLFTIVAGVIVALHADRLAHRRRVAVMAGYFEHVLYLPMSFHTDTHSGRVLKVMIEGTNGMKDLWLAFFREHCAAFVSLIVFLPLTMFLNWRLGLMLVILVAVFAVLTAFVLNKTENLQGEVERYHSDLAEHASDALGNVPVIQSFTRIGAELKAVRHIIERLLAAQMPVLNWWALAAIASRASATLTSLGILVLGTVLFVQGLATVGEIVTFTTLSGALIGKLEQAVGFVNFVLMIAPKMREFFGILDTVPAVRNRPDAKPLAAGPGRVAFENVSYSYDGKRAAVADLTFVAEPGETIALVGPTGSGKSTSLSLLFRSFDPQSGRIVIDGQDIRDLTLESLRANIGVVFQEPMLFARSIRENLEIGKADASDAEMHAALARAQATEIIARQPEGLDTIVGERGRTLSGGERQRLSIARALLKNPPILVLDEATSALDATTETKLKAALDEVMAGRTTFVIAHRLATIRNASRILVLDQGRLVEAGTFEELEAKGGVFAELARAQFMTAERRAALPDRDIVET
jgi:ATP-binding cassette subfamily B protein